MFPCHWFELFYLMIDKVSAYFSVAWGYFLEFKERIGIPPLCLPVVASCAWEAMSLSVSSSWDSFLNLTPRQHQVLYYIKGTLFQLSKQPVVFLNLNYLMYIELFMIISLFFHIICFSHLQSSVRVPSTDVLYCKAALYHF